LGINLGFVAICLSEKDCSPAATVPLKSVANLPPDAVRSRVERTALRNLINTLRIMYFLPSHGLKLYRFSSGLIPLATHPITDGWAWWDEPALRKEMEKIGRVAKSHGIRLSMHAPSQVILNAPKPETFEWTTRYLEYLDRLFAAMKLGPETKVVFHVGGLYGNKAKALDMLRQNVGVLKQTQRDRIVLENDDKLFTAEEVLAVAEELGFPMVLDVHHHLCLPSPKPGYKKKHALISHS
jgi:UV DNA damage endonuclease